MRLFSGYAMLKSVNEIKLDLIDESKALNSKLFSLQRLLILSSLKSFGQDGVTYRELKAGLGLDDGILFSNLKALQEMRYIKGNKIKAENMDMTAFVLTEEGNEAFKSVKQWLKKLVDEGGE